MKESCSWKREQLFYWIQAIKKQKMTTSDYN